MKQKSHFFPGFQGLPGAGYSASKRKLSFALSQSQLPPTWEIIIPLLWGETSSHVGDKAAMLDWKKRCSRGLEFPLFVLVGVVLIRPVCSHLVQARAAENGGFQRKQFQRERKKWKKKKNAGKKNDTVTCRHKNLKIGVEERRYWKRKTKWNSKGEKSRNERKSKEIQ